MTGLALDRRVDSSEKGPGAILLDPLWVILGGWSHQRFESISWDSLQSVSMFEEDPL